MAREDPRGVPSIPTSRQTWRAGAEDAVADPSRRLADLEADLMALAAADDDLERDAEIAERIRIERAGVTWSARLRATHDSVVVRSIAGDARLGRRRHDGGFRDRDTRGVRAGVAWSPRGA